MMRCLGERVRALRRRRGFSSVHHLAREACVGVQTLVNLERYSMPPRRRETVERIARALGCTVEELGWREQGGGDDSQ